MSHILIADDDTDLTEGLTWYLEAEGYRVTAVSDGTAALSTFREYSPDLVILDIMMPGMDGVQVCEAIRKESDAYVMMLSARDGEIDKVRALSIGADDYVTKPFHVTELVARVKAMLRRGRATQTEPGSYSYKVLEVVVEQRQVRVNKANVDLTTMEFELLVALLRRPRTVLSRDELIKIMWGGDFYGELRLVDNHVYHLREKLAAAGFPDFPIVTVRGVGYAFRPEE
jgi:DNA-binding response OmpR family regulator